MKTYFLVLLSTCLIGSVFAAEKIVAGPKGGRLLATTAAKAEFFVTKERNVEVTFLDTALKPIPVGERVVNITAEPKSGRVPLTLEKTAHGYRSRTPLPAGDPYRVVVQVRDSGGAKPQNFRLDLDLAECGECKLAEYACTCAH